MSEKIDQQTSDISLFAFEVMLAIYTIVGGLITIGMAWMNSNGP